MQINARIVRDVLARDSVYLFSSFFMNRSQIERLLCFCRGEEGKLNLFQGLGHRDLLLSGLSALCIQTVFKGNLLEGSFILYIFCSLSFLLGSFKSQLFGFPSFKSTQVTPILYGILLNRIDSFVIGFSALKEKVRQTSVQFIGLNRLNFIKESNFDTIVLEKDFKSFKGQRERIMRFYALYTLRNYFGPDFIKNCPADLKNLASVGLKVIFGMKFSGI